MTVLAIAALVVSSLAPDVYWVQGPAGNAGIIVGKQGVIVVDTAQTAASAKELVAEIAKVSPKPITHVILTNADVEHAGGLAGFPAGVTVIAHEGAGGEFAAVPKDRQPSRLIARTGETTTIDGIAMSFHHWAPAHTNGDLVVYLPAQKVAFVGDLVAADVDPVIRLDKKGSSEGWITSVKGLLGLGASKIVPGHGDLRTAAEVQARLTEAAAKRDKIASLVREGKSLDAVKAEDASPFALVVYQELTHRQR